MSHDRYNKNFTAFKVTVDYTSNPSRKELRDAVTTWCENNLALVGAGYTIRSNTADGMFRVMVNELKVRNSGYTQLIWLKRDRKGPTDIKIDLSGEVL